MSETGNKLQKEILAAAIQCFRDKGYENVSVKDICETADIARSTFYRAFSSKKDVVRFMFEHADTNYIVSIEDLVGAENDFERMWIIGDRYISLCKELGVAYCAAMMSMCVQGDVDLLALGHSVDEWFIRLTRNCQKTGIILSSEPPELLGPLFVDMEYHVIYDWCRHQGNFPIRATSRQRAEMIGNVAPEYRWTEEQLEQADRE